MEATKTSPENFLPPGEAIAKMANNDTPPFVEVKNGQQIVTWLVGKLGIGIIGFVFFYMIYQDMRKDTDRVLSKYEGDSNRLINAYEKSIESQTKFKEVLESQGRILEGYARILEKIEAKIK